MKWLAWALRRWMIYRGTRFVVIATFFGPATCGLLMSIVTAFPPYGPKSVFDQSLISLVFAFAALLYGAVPAFVASILIVVRRFVSVVEALAITVVTTFVLYFVFFWASSWFSAIVPAAAAGLAMSLFSIPGAVGAGLLAAWWGAFTPSELHRRAAAPSSTN